MRDTRPSAERRGPERTEVPIDWTAVGRSAEFRELTRGRRSFVTTASVVGLGAGALYVVAVSLAGHLAQEQVLGGISLGFLGGVGLVALTIVITLAYEFVSNRVWEPLGERVRELALKGELSQPVPDRPAPLRDLDLDLPQREPA